jgi:hypothetical protein
LASPGREWGLRRDVGDRADDGLPAAVHDDELDLHRPLAAARRLSTASSSSVAARLSATACEAKASRSIGCAVEARASAIVSIARLSSATRRRAIMALRRSRGAISLSKAMASLAASAFWAPESPGSAMLRGPPHA